MEMMKDIRDRELKPTKTIRNCTELNAIEKEITSLAWRREEVRVELEEARKERNLLSAKVAAKIGLLERVEKEYNKVCKARNEIFKLEFTKR